MKSLIFAVLFVVMPVAAHAYVGPGAGLGVIAVTLATLLGLVLLIFGFLWYPLKRMLSKKKADTGSQSAPGVDE